MSTTEEAMPIIKLVSVTFNGAIQVAGYTFREIDTSGASAPRWSPHLHVMSQCVLLRSLGSDTTILIPLHQVRHMEVADKDYVNSAPPPTDHDPLGLPDHKVTESAIYTEEHDPDTGEVTPRYRGIIETEAAIYRAKIPPMSPKHKAALDELTANLRNKFDTTEAPPEPLFNPATAEVTSTPATRHPDPAHPSNTGAATMTAAEFAEHIASVGGGANANTRRKRGRPPKAAQ